ncbi:MAG: hypothetical protein GTN62_15150 [Gemmatimonadales bacterium]|nr:hypothetical protein [Gemmatimonadales bacterium]NIN13148.1 hypothetical protein [Gemmatimonadales bacterium]NIN51426.1 hypothetical protein [Gemmatimonadales bacterium]NIP08890.1 hypothetical protein [Gemmatimonadales bacterium]NIR03678.1 hypothetical protein [Gemmatimonadales bacterium]
MGDGSVTFHAVFMWRLTYVLAGITRSLPDRYRRVIDGDLTTKLTVALEVSHLK